MSLTLRCCCGGVAGSETEAEEPVPTTNGGICRVSGDIIIANEGDSVCVALWPDGAGPGAAGEDTDAGADEEDEEEEDEVGSAASGGAWVGVISIGSAAAIAAGVRHLYDGLPLPYGDARSAPVAAPTSPSGYLRFRDADGGVSGATAGNRISSLITATGRAEGARTGTADEEETDKRRTEDDEDAGVVLAAADTGGGKAADEDGGAGRVHLISQGGGGGMWAPGALIR